MRRLTGEQRDAVTARINALADANGGRITGSMVIRDAKNKSSPLHDEIPWDVNKNSMHWQLVVARRLIARVRVVERTETMVLKTFAYVRDPTRAASEPGYIATVKLKREVDFAREALRAECVRLDALMRRLQLLAETLGLRNEIDALLLGVQNLRQAVPEVEVHVH